jgi:hypothetical protein
VESSNARSSAIFVVHGRSRHKDEVADVLVSAGVEPIILEERPNRGAVVIEKFEKEAARATHAVVILAADDEGRLASDDELKPRARQNVIAEFGYFWGKLGRSKVITLCEHGIEEPGDFQGLVRNELDSWGRWKEKLIQELEAQGLVRTSPTTAQHNLVTVARALLDNATRLIDLLQGLDRSLEDQRWFVGEDVARVRLAGLLLMAVADGDIERASNDLIGFVRSEIDCIREVEVGRLDRGVWDDRLGRMESLIQILERESGS